jgi:5-formyltetrahydrofolate cyclo-ligase
LARLTKDEARERGRALRASLSEVQREENDAAVIKQCRDEIDWSGLQRVHLFLPIRRRQEIDTWKLIEWLWDAHAKVRTYVPRLVAGELEQVRATIGTGWYLNRYQIPEPFEGEVLGDEEPLDLIFAPLLCVDLHGCRVGYGGGFYDKFMATRPHAKKVGLAYESWLTRDDIETNARDVRLDGVVTEQRVHWFAES